MQGRGFHRLLRSRLVVEAIFLAHAAAGGGGVEVEETRVCQLLLVDWLPHTVYVDEFELAQAARFGGNLSRIVQGPGGCTRGGVSRGACGGVDLEVPATSARARQLLVETKGAYVGGAPASALVSEQTLELPLHSRYQAPSFRGVVGGEVRVPSPLMFARCGRGSERGGAWRAVLMFGLDGGGRGGQVDWQIPVGREQDRWLVSWVTLLVTLAATLVCLYETLVVIPSQDSEAPSARVQPRRAGGASAVVSATAGLEQGQRGGRRRCSPARKRGQKDG